MSDDEVPTKDDAGDVSGELATPPEAAADQSSADDEDGASSSLPIQTAVPEKSEEGEPVGEPDTSEEVPAPVAGEGASF